MRGFISQTNRQSEQKSMLIEIKKQATLPTQRPGRGFGIGEKPICHKPIPTSKIHNTVTTIIRAELYKNSRNSVNTHTQRHTI